MVLKGCPQPEAQQSSSRKITCDSSLSSLMLSDRPSSKTQMLTFRFAAAECVNSDDRPKALSTVLAGGVAAGVLGPQLVSATMDLSPHTYALTYIAAAGPAALTGWILWDVRFSPQIAHSEARPSGSIAEVLRQPRFVIAMACGVVSYMMNFMMTSAPLAMDLCGIARVHLNTGIELHVNAMYAPSFFTGRLISRLGAPLIIQLGLR